jgi:hypothetical protein
MAKKPAATIDSKRPNLDTEEGRHAYLRNLEERHPTLFAEQLAEIRAQDPHPVLVILPPWVPPDEYTWLTRPGTAPWFFPELRSALFQNDHPPGALFVLFVRAHTFTRLVRATEAAPAPGVSKKDLLEFARQEREQADELEERVAEMEAMMAGMELEAAGRRQVAAHAEEVAKTMKGTRK